MSTNDEARCGRTKTAIALDIIGKLHRIVLDDRRVKVGQIADIVGSSNNSVQRMLIETLVMIRYVECRGCSHQNKTEYFSRTFGTYLPLNLSLNPS